MAKKKEDVSYWSNMLEPGLYKRNQGRLTRQLTAVSFVLIIFLGAWTLSGGPLSDYDKQPLIHLGIPILVAAIGAWIVYRTVNYPTFADFLISVEAEMDKVTWATKTDLYRSTIVVNSVMFFLGFTLFVYDLFWQCVFQLIGFLQLGPGS